MVLNIRSQFVDYFNSVDSAGNPISNDIVRATVQFSNNAYFDGYTYSAEPTTLILKNLNDGRYSLSLNFQKTGLYTIRMWSSANKSLAKDLSIEVMSDHEIVKRRYLVGQMIPFKLSKVPSDTSATISIQNLDTTFFLNNVGMFQRNPNLVSMNAGNDTEFTFDVILPEGTYEVVMSTESKMLTCTAVVSSVSGEELVDIDHTIISDPSGNSSITVDSKYSPMSGVTIKAFDPSTQTVRGVASSDSKGGWSMSVPRGSYLYKFMKEGYNSVLFEGQVL